MIPKTLHYCWFGGSPEPPLMLRYRETWSNAGSGYEIKRWDESNSPMFLPYLQNAARHHRWANMSNLVRLYALFLDGGIYLDTDVEVVKTFDPLRASPAFLGIQTSGGLINNAVFGATRGHPFVFLLLLELLRCFDGTEPANESSPNLTTRLLLNSQSCHIALPTMIQGLLVLPTDFFYPYFYGEEFRPSCISENTVAIHHWARSW